jgi:hypothetical protein
MAPAQSKLKQADISGPRKRKVSSRITDENFIGAESNAVTKRLKLSADAAHGASAKQKKIRASVEDIEDEDSTIPVNSPPKNPNSLLEAADGSDDEIVVDDDPAPPLEECGPENGVDDEDDEDDEDETTKPVETAEAERSESNKMV